jgi:hypothetical protein
MGTRSILNGSIFDSAAILFLSHYSPGLLSVVVVV